MHLGSSYKVGLHQQFSNPLPADCQAGWGDLFLFRISHGPGRKKGARAGLCSPPPPPRPDSTPAERGSSSPLPCVSSGRFKGNGKQIDMR